MGPHLTLPRAASARDARTFGGVVPSAATARDSGTLVAALGVEHHADGAVLPLLVLSEAPGVLSWEPLDAVTVVDDLGRDYATSVLHGQAGLGSLQASLWLDPAPPADARRLSVAVPELARVASARGGSGVTRPLSGGPWELEIDLLPPRTRIPAPESSPGTPATAPAPRVPVRAVGALVDIVPVGQARMVDDLAVCLWALERYEDAGVLTLALLAAADDGPPTPADDVRVSAWDDAGTDYEVAFEGASGSPGWSEIVVRLSPQPAPDATGLGLRVVTDTPAAGTRELVFGVALPPLR